MRRIKIISLVFDSLSFKNTEVLETYQEMQGLYLGLGKEKNGNAFLKDVQAKIDLY